MTPADPWALARRVPQVILPEEEQATEQQWARFATMTWSARLALGLHMSEVALRQRRERLERQFPDADTKGISWAVIREILELEPGTQPVPR